MARRMRGHQAVRVMVEAIGSEIGTRRLIGFERQVRAQLRANGHVLELATAHDWIYAMAQVIVANEDKKADAGFQKGIRFIRSQAAVD